MQIPVHTFYLLRKVFLDSNQDDDLLSIDEFLYYALLSKATSRLDQKSDGSPSHVYLEKLSDECQVHVKNYRLILMMAQVRPPNGIRNRLFILEEYLALRDVAASIHINNSELFEQDTLGNSEEIH